MATQGKKLDDLKDVFFKEIGKFIEILTTENDEAKNFINEEINKFLGVISFTESPDNIPMWAYYADVHKGFVIIFNSENDFFNNGLLSDKDFGILQKINYCPEKTVLTSFKEFKSNPFFEKHLRWCNEEEWRMILPLSLTSINKSPDIYLINIPPELIIGIIFGFRTEPALIDYVGKLKLQKEMWNHLELYKAIPFLDNYKMDLIRL